MIEVTVKICILFYSINVLSLSKASPTTITRYNHTNGTQDDIDDLVICVNVTGYTANNTNCTVNPKNTELLIKDQVLLSFYFTTIIFTVIAYAVILPSAYKKSQASSVFIFSLAFADLFVALVVVPTKISEVYDSTWLNELTVCRSSNSITVFGIATAACNMMIVSVDRLFYFQIPMTYHTVVTVKRAVTGCLLSYVYTLPALFPIIGIGGFNFKKQMPYCAFKFTLSKSYLWFVGMAYFFIPVSFIILAQIQILRKTRSHYQQHRDLLKISKTSQITVRQIELSIKREMRIQRMFLYIVIMFVVCWGPFVFSIIFTLTAPHLITTSFIHLVRVLIFSNCFINPFVMVISLRKLPFCCHVLLNLTTSKRRKRHQVFPESTVMTNSKKQTVTNVSQQKEMSE